MKAYIQCEKGKINNDNFFKAYLGFKEMGFETVLFSTEEELMQSNKEDVVVGYIGTVLKRLHDFDIVVPNLDYPDELKKNLGRKIWESTINAVASSPEIWPVFVKPKEIKAFTGVVVNSTQDLIGCGAYNGDREVFCSEIVHFVSEWRCFVRYGKIIDVRPYKGDWKCHYDSSVIENCISDYTDCPAGTGIDFGLTDDGRTILIEVNNGYSLGSYGLYYPEYAKLLSARWAELTDTKDECDFLNERSLFLSKKLRNK